MFSMCFLVFMSSNRAEKGIASVIMRKWCVIYIMLLLFALPCYIIRGCKFVGV